MPVTIRNLTDKLVLLRFRSGLTRHLAPNETLEGLEDVEIKGNDRIKRLEDRRIIAVHGPPSKGKPEEKRPRRSKEMRAEDAVEVIRSTPLKELQDFLSPDEERVTVQQAMEEKRRK